MAEFSLTISTDWTERKRAERILKAVENLTPQDSLCLEAPIGPRADAIEIMENAIKLLQTSFDQRINITSQGERKAKVQLKPLKGGCCGACGGDDS